MKCSTVTCCYDRNWSRSDELRNPRKKISWKLSSSKFKNARIPPYLTKAGAKSFEVWRLVNASLRIHLHTHAQRLLSRVMSVPRSTTFLSLHSRLPLALTSSLKFNWITDEEMKTQDHKNVHTWRARRNHKLYRFTLVVALTVLLQAEQKTLTSNKL